MDTNDSIRLGGLAVKTVVVHTVTYFLMGALAYTFLDYEKVFASPEMACWMRPVSDPLVMAGPLFQPIRGLIFAFAFYPFREVLFAKPKGWLNLWWLLVALGILSTFGPAPGSIEGMIYTILPIPGQMRGWLEVVPQALFLSLILFYWIRNPKKRWLNWTLGIIFIIMMLMSVAGLLVPAGQMQP